MDERLAAPDAGPDPAVYRFLAEHVGDIVLVLDGGLIRWASASAESVLGRPVADLAGCPFWQFVHPDDRGPGEAGRAPAGRHRIRTHDDGYAWFDARSWAGRPTSPDLVCLVLRDIDETVRLESLVGVAQRRKHRALDASPDGFAIYDVVRGHDGVVTGLRLHFINAAGAAGFAGDATALVGKDLLEFYPEAAGNGLRRDLITAWHTGEPQHSHLVIDGPSWAGTIHGIQVRLDADTVMSTWRDVSQELKVREELAAAHAAAEEARATLQAALDATSDGFIVIDVVRDGRGHAAGFRVVTCNAAAVAPLGLTADQVVGRDPADLAPTWRSTGLSDLVLAALTEGRPRQARLHVNGPDGDLIRSRDHTIACVGPDRAVITFRDATADERQRRALEASRSDAERSARHDALTDLPNRVLLRERLEAALHGCARGHVVGVVFCDLDDFKAVNDEYGHAAGDAVLKATAERLRRLVRAQDTAARLGGDEFVVVLSHLPQRWTGADFLDRAHGHLRQPVAVGDALLAPSASLGLYLADPHARPVEDRDPDGVIARADRAMYLSKSSRRADLRSGPSPAS